MMELHPARQPHLSFLQRHSLGLICTGLLLIWIVLYVFSDPGTHIGSFYGNAIADWSGVVISVFGTKYLYERGSIESRRPHGHLASRWREWLRNHSLTIFLLMTGIGWVVLYIKMNSEAKWGKVVGNIVSEWTQIIGLVLMTKRFIEEGSKESRR